MANNDIKTMIEIAGAIKKVQSEQRYYVRAQNDVIRAKTELDELLEKSGLEPMTLEEVLSLNKEED